MKHPHNKLLTTEQHEFLAKHIPGTPNQELVYMLNEKFGLSLTLKQIKSYKKNHRNTLPKSGLTGHFPKGHIPQNKGTKGLYNVGGNKTSFKKGQKPHNFRPIGSERIDVDGYVLVKVQNHGPSNQRWKFKARLVWEKANGPIPKNYTLIYLDGNKKNCNLENLKLITRNELFQMNRMKIERNSEEVTQVALTLAKISIRKTEIKKRK